MYQSLKMRGKAASDHYAGSWNYFYLTPASLTLLQGLMPLLEEHCRGRVLDAGAGRGAYRGLLLNYASEYVGIDIAASVATSVVGDAQRLPFVDSSFDTVFCSQVLEHVPEPWHALAEFHRALKPGGKLILSVPHISWLHNEPHDYYRYTRHGLSFLLKRAGFSVRTLNAAGGLPSVLGHILSTIVVNSTFRISGVNRLCFLLNKLFVIAMTAFDRKLEKKKVFALNYVLVAEK